MTPIRVRRHIDHDLAEAIPELREMMGRDVEITVVPHVWGKAGTQSDPQDPFAETLETFLGPERPPATPEEMAELRALAEKEPGLAAFLELADDGGLDVDMILAIRNAE